MSVAWNQLLLKHAHRPFPLPSHPWVMTMSWEHLLFAHWEIPVSIMRDRVPPSLELDLWEGRAWIGLVPFQMNRVGPRGLNWLPWVSAFPEINLRTYVKKKGKAGVFFFSLDAANWLAVIAARIGFHLPYYWAQIHKTLDGPRVRYESTRWLGGEARLAVEFQPTGEITHAAPGSFDHFLTERYCLYAVDRRGQAYCSEVHHLPWPLQPAEVHFERNTMGAWMNLPLPDTRPVLHFARRLDVVAWWPEKV